MTILSVEDLGKNFGIAPLFSGLTFGLEERDRVGLIGANGSGKTTLLRIIAGEESADAGRVMLAGNPVVGYLSQNPEVDESRTVLDTIFAASSETMRLLHDYEAVCARVAGNAEDDEAMARMSALAAQLESSGAWELETVARTVLSRLGITDTSAVMGTLSGGQRKRVMLAHALIERPDLLILDEPTNHLDAETIEWLEEYLSRYTGALLLVTHDRYFLDRVTNKIIEIDRGSVQTYAGNYAYYLEQKEAESERQETEAHKREMLIRNELAWLRRGAKARRTKQKARIERAEELMAAPKAGRREELDIALASRRLGSKVLELHGVSKGYGGRTLLADYTRMIQPGERLGIIGPNGSGKTTLLDIVVGAVEPDRGRVETGGTVVVGYYDQESRALDDEQRVIEYIREIAETIKTADGGTITASQMLERFLFTPAMQYAPIGRLSGGERRRLYLLRILMGAPNVLLLDEPTNDLDIATLMALENYLDSFSGSVIVVSHDRYFLDRTVDHLIRFEGEGAIREYPGNYSAFLEIREREAADAAATARLATPEPKQEERRQTERKGLSYKERQELQTLEKAIEGAEAKRAEIEDRLSLVGTDYIAATALGREISELDEQLARDMERWAELAEKAEG